MFSNSTAGPNYSPIFTCSQVVTREGYCYKLLFGPVFIGKYDASKNTAANPPRDT